MNVTKATAPFAAATLAIALAAPLGAQAAQGLNFNPNGVGGLAASTFGDMWTWRNATVMGQHHVTQQTNLGGSNFLSLADANITTPQLVMQARANQMLIADTATEVLGDADMDNFTMVMYVDVSATRTGLGDVMGMAVDFNMASTMVPNDGTAVSWDSTGQDLTVMGRNTFELYFHATPPTDAELASGTIFNDGLLILSGRVELEPGTSFLQITTMSGTTDLDSNAQDIANTVFLTGNVRANIDVCTAAEIGTVGSLCEFGQNGTGGAGDVSVVNEDFFPSVEFDFIEFDFDIIDALEAPFSGRAPDKVADMDANLTSDAGALGLPITSTSAVNRLGCTVAGAMNLTQCDTVASAASPASIWKSNALPEPGSLALLGLGLAGLGFMGRRRKKS